MKKLSVTVKTLVAAALVLSATSCSENKADNAATSAVASTETSSPEASAPKSNIRYIDADSVISAYTLAQQLFAEQQREVNNVQQWHDS